MISFWGGIDNNILSLKMKFILVKVTQARN